MIKLRKLLDETFADAAFHGYKMSPAQMRTSTCSTEWTTPSQDTGCPQFSDSSKISKEDEQKALDYLNKENIEHLVAYSRGGAILLQALSKGSKKPSKVVFVAPAWNRQWPSSKLSGGEASGLSGTIVHGSADDAVPVKHSIMLAQKSNLPVYVVKNANHINILKYKDSPESGIRITNLEDAINKLPDWGETGKASPEDLKAQIDYINSLK